uniref:peptidase S74 n=1 Tax=Streptococcus pneumoniae TaxID=1313 RepID=UPI001D0CC51C
MDALTRRQFDRAMFAKERTLAIRVGDYASRDIKEASFEYGYIKGDTYKPGGTCAGSGKITFTSIITTFNKLDTLHPEIGLLVGDTYQWVKMGEYFINDIEIDRNRNTTTLELMDGMFKLNREYVTDLHFPAEVREVIQEICLKTGIELANDYFGISAMRYHIEQVPEGKKLSFRDMLSAMTQMIGMSCFFNREGKMEIRDLTESNITINADSYFLHGLTKSEIEYQIAGITCKTDKKSLTVGMKTGRSLELDNVFMTQSALNDLYYKLKNLTYYPYNLNYQGHLLLEVGQWVTIQTNKKETFKVPVLSQSFIFKGGLRGRISADSKAGNDTQYSYEGTITKQIKQQDGIEAKIQAQIEAADKDFDQKVDKIKKDFNDQVELAKARAEEVKRELSDTINQRFNSFDNGPLKETKHKAEEALRNAGASTLLAQEAKRIGLDSVARLEAFKSQTTSAQTALSGDLDALKRTIANDIRPKQAQAETEIAKQVEALSRTKNELAGVKSAQATYEETTTRRLSELTNLANGKASKSELTQTAEELASRIASVQAGSSRNYFRNSRSRTFTTGGQAVYDYRTFIVPDFWKNSDRFKRDYVRISFDVTFPVALVNDMPAMVHFSAHPWYAYRNLIFKGGTVERQHFEFTIDLSSSSEDYQTNNVFIRFGTNYGFPAGLQVVIENAMLSVGNYFPAYQPAYEDQEDRVSVVESNFKQRADSLDAGVSRLTEGLRTKADISSLNVTAENIRQSVKSLETDTQNKLNQKLSQAEFEVRAGSIRQEILNATKNKASKSELTQTAEELSSKIASVQVGGRNYIRGTKRMMLARGLWASGTFRPSGAGTAKTIDVSDSPVTGFDKAIRLTSSNARDQIGIAQDGFYISQGTYTMSCWVKGRRGQKVKLQTYWQVHDNSGISPIFTLKDENWTKLSFTSARNRAGVASIGYVYLVNAEVGEYLDVLAPQLEDGSLATSSKEAPEDIEGHISTVESTFKQRANSLDAGVSRLTEGLRTKVDISALNVTAENIRQSVKSLETDTQNKLNQKLSQAEFEVRAGSIRQEILNATKDKASKSELTQTAEELSSKIASVHLGRRNLLKGTKELARYKPVSEYNGFKVIRTVAGATRYQDSYVERTVIPTAGTEYIAIFYARASENDYPVRCHFYNPNTVVSSENSSGYKSRSSDGLSIIRLSTDWQLCWVKWSQTATDQAKTVIIGRHGPQVGGKEGVWVEICAPAIFEGNLAGDWSPAYEDQEDRVSVVESNFKQRADSLDAGVSRLTEGLRTKADISSLNVTAENIRQSVKSLETDTQNKLNQKLSQAEFEVRAGSIRQEILNVTKDKASKSELTQTAEELSSKIASVQVGGINLLRNTASLLIGDRSKGCWMSASGGNGRAISVEVLDPPKKMIKNMIRVIENTNGGNKDLTQLVRLRIGEKYTISCYARIASDSPNANVNLLFRSWANNTDLNRKFQKSISHKNWQKYSFTFTADAIENSIQFGQSGAGIIEICAPKIESGTLATDYSEAPEDIEGQISTVESTFKQRANSLDAGVSRLTEGLRTKVDISALNVTAENIRQSVKSLETDTQNKLNQKLSQAEFEVRA